MSVRASFDATRLPGVLSLLEPASSCWTLHGGGAVVYHLGHRTLSELDFYKENYARPDVSMLAALAALARFGLADEQLSKVKRSFEDDQSRTVKIFFEKITLSFVKRPKSSGRWQRHYIQGMLPVAGLQDALGAKLYALCERDMFNDYYDVVTALERGWGVEFLVRGFENAVEPSFDRGILSQRLKSPPPDIAVRLSARQISLLQAAAAQAGVLLSGG